MGIINASLARTGEKNGAWRGDKALYGSIHDWVQYHLGKSKECVYCGHGGRIEWASISHKAKRDLNDYIPLCVRCHRIYDDNMPSKYNRSKEPQVREKISQAIYKHWELRRKRLEETRKFYA